jgi:hypothetical protein
VPDIVPEKTSCNTVHKQVIENQLNGHIRFAVYSSTVPRVNVRYIKVYIALERIHVHFISQYYNVLPAPTTVLPLHSVKQKYAITLETKYVKKKNGVPRSEEGGYHPSIRMKSIAFRCALVWK